MVNHSTSTLIITIKNKYAFKWATPRVRLQIRGYYRILALQTISSLDLFT